MKRDRIVNLGPNFIAGQMRSQFVSRLRSNNELMIDVMIADAFPIGFGWEDDRIAKFVPRKFLAIKISGGTTGGRPVREMRQFHLKNRRLQFIEPEISADKLMVISRFHSMLAADSEARRQIFVVTNNCACVAGGTEILGRVEAEAADVTDCASRSSPIGLRIS